MNEDEKRKLLVLQKQIKTKKKDHIKKILDVKIHPLQGRMREQNNARIKWMKMKKEKYSFHENKRKQGKRSMERKLCISEFIPCKRTIGRQMNVRRN